MTRRNFIIGIAALALLSLSTEALSASAHKKAHSLQKEKDYLVALYKREQKNPRSDKLSGITLRLHEIQAELDALTGGNGLVEDSNAHGRRRRSGRGSSTNNRY